jgi:hypothetical protein
MSRPTHVLREQLEKTVKQLDDRVYSKPVTEKNPSLVKKKQPTKQIKKQGHFKFSTRYKLNSDC